VSFKKKKQPEKQNFSTKALENKKVKSKSVLHEEPSLYIIEKSKESLDELVKKLNKSALALPSLVVTKSETTNNNNLFLQNKFEIDIELIGMLEDFFRRLVLLLRYRTNYDEKLRQISNQIKNLMTTSSLMEFKGKMQLLGITLNEAEQIAKNYEEIYNGLFTDQALLQFQLMEQLMLFREKTIPEFKENFNAVIKSFMGITEEISKLKE